MVILIFRVPENILLRSAVQTNLSPPHPQFFGAKVQVSALSVTAIICYQLVLFCLLVTCCLLFGDALLTPCCCMFAGQPTGGSLQCSRASLLDPVF